MKNNLTMTAALFFLVTFGFGCSFIDNLSGGGSSNTTTTTNSSTNSSTNSADPNAAAKTGVAECDELIDLLNQDKSDPNDNLFTRKIKEYAIDFAKESIKENIEKNQGDKTKIAEGCKKAKDDYLKKKEENNQEDPKNSDKTSNTQSM